MAKKNNGKATAISVAMQHVTNTSTPNIASMYDSNDLRVGHDYSSKSYSGLTPALGVLLQSNTTYLAICRCDTNMACTDYRRF